MSMNKKFKVGDKVKCICSAESMIIQEGSFYTISAIRNDGKTLFLKEFEKEAFNYDSALFELAGIQKEFIINHNNSVKILVWDNDVVKDVRERYPLCFFTNGSCLCVDGECEDLYEQHKPFESATLWKNWERLSKINKNQMEKHIKVEMGLPEMGGYAYTGEYRIPQKDEYFLCPATKNINNYVAQCESMLETVHHILKKKKWRAEVNGIYYHINSLIEVMEDKELNTGGDTKKYKVGNYFKTIQQAEAISLKIKKLLLKEN